jgi:hypothetical protein
MTTTDKINYNNATYGTAITCTLNSLAASLTVGRQSTPVDNTANLFIDAAITAIIKNGSSAPGGSASVYIYGFGQYDGVPDYDQDDGVMGAADAGYTINSPTNLHGPIVMYTPTASKIYNKTFNLSQLFGGLIPAKWGLVVCQDTGQALASSGNSLSYTGIYMTNG